MSLLVMCLTVSMAFVSCGDDKDEPKGGDLVEKLQGTWYFDIMKMNAMGQTIEMDKEFIMNGSGYDQFYDDVLTFSGEKVNGSSFQVNGKKIMLPWYDNLDWWATVSFTGNKMTLYYDIYYEGTPIKMWITYVKSGSRCSYNLIPQQMPTLIPEAIKAAN